MSEPAKAIRRIFNMFDLDKNGVIDRDELRTVMKGLQLFPSSTQLRHIIADVDTKQDGVIDFEEFAAMRRGEGTARARGRRGGDRVCRLCD